MLSLLAAQDSPSPLVVAILFTVVIFPLGWIIGYLCAYRYKRQYLRAGRELASLKGENFRSELKTIGIPQGARVTGSPPPRQAAATEPVHDDPRQPLREELETISETLRETRASLAECEHELRKALQAKNQVTAERDAIQEQLETIKRQDTTRSDDGHVEMQEIIASLQAKVLELEEQRDEARRSADDASQASSGGDMATWQLEQLHREQITMQLRMDDYAVQVQELTAERDAARAELRALRQQLSETANWKDESNP